MSSAARGNAIVVGGGLIGAASAYYLSRSGWQVTIVEQNKFGSGCSHGNCGFVSPSHVLPLATPGAAKMAMKSLLTPNSPFKIRPRFDLTLWKWLWRFMRRCNEHDMLESAAGIHALLLSSRKLYDQLFAEETFDCEWQTLGLLFVFRTLAALEKHVAVDERAEKSLIGNGNGAAHAPRKPVEKLADAPIPNLYTRRFDSKTLLELEPALKPGLAGGLLYEFDAHLRPDRLMSSWRKVLENRGIPIRENCRVDGITGDTGNTARSLQTAEGPLRADTFVFALGAWTPLLNRHLGCKVPIQPGKGYSMTMPLPAICPKYPMLLEEDRVAVTPMKSGYRLGSTMEFAGYDARLNPKRLELLRRGAAHYLREPYCEPVLEKWCGWRPMTYDSRPIIDRSPAWRNVYIAAGHNMLGLSMSPATGRLVAEMVDGQTPHIDVAPYRATRF
jgi:D-amino-acid dehydrogenase